jgi:5'-3' exonuclease
MSRHVDIWDLGLLCRYFYAPGGQERAAENFAKLVKSHQQSDATVVCRDTPEPTWRHQIYPEYKANRSRPPEEQAALDEQRRKACELLKGFATVRSAPGWEADDLCATLALRAVNAGWEATVFSGDKDILQLVGLRGLQVHDGREPKTSECVQAKLGVLPMQVADYLALVGDTADNIPGVKGIGPKAAAWLLDCNATLAEAIDRAPACQSSPPYRKLLAGKDNAVLSRKLTALDWAVPESAIRKGW